MITMGSWRSLSAFQFIHRLNVTQRPEVERRVAFFRNEALRFFIIVLRELLKDLAGLHRQGAVDKNRHLRQVAVTHHAVEIVNQLLRAPDRESRDDDLAAAFQCAPGTHREIQQKHLPDCCAVCRRRCIP